MAAASPRRRLSNVSPKRIIERPSDLPSVFGLRPGEQVTLGQAIDIAFVDFRQLQSQQRKAIRRSLKQQALETVCRGHFAQDYAESDITEADMILTASSTTDHRLLAFFCAKQTADTYYKVSLLCAGQVTCRSSLSPDDRKRLSGLGNLLHVIFLTYLQSLPAIKTVFLAAARPELVPYYQQLGYRTGREGDVDEKEQYEEEVEVRMSRSNALNVHALQEQAVANLIQSWSLLDHANSDCVVTDFRRKRKLSRQ